MIQNKMEGLKLDDIKIWTIFISLTRNYTILRIVYNIDKTIIFYYKYLYNNRWVLETKIKNNYDYETFIKLFSNIQNIIWDTKFLFKCKKI